MKNQFAGLILIILGFLIISIVAGEFLLRAAITVFGLYLMYTGLNMRNRNSQVLFHFHRFTNRFNRF